MVNIVNILKNYILRIISIIFIIHIPRVYIDNKQYLLKNLIRHGEDSYQHNINEKKDRSRIISWTSYNISNSDWKQHIKKIKTDIITLIRDEIDVMKDISSEEIISYVDNKSIKSYTIDNNNAICVWINNKTKTIRTAYDHEFCGGYFFVKYGALLARGDPPKLPTVPIYTPFIVEKEMLKLLYQNPHKARYQKYKLVNKLEDITRITYRLDKKNKPDNCSTKMWILWNLITGIMDTDKTREGLDIMIPIAFNKLPNIYNNIGVIFIKYKRGDTIDMLDKQIEQKKYGALAVNYYLRLCYHGSKRGERVRNSVDIVYTSSYISNSIMKCTNHITTYNQIADYAIYCFSATIKDNIRVTVTLNTNELNCTRLMASLPNSESVHGPK